MQLSENQTLEILSGTTNELLENLILQHVEYLVFKILTSTYFGCLGGFGRVKMAGWVKV